MANGQAPSSKTPKPVIGLVGGIGSGKSSVAAEFARQGAAVISGDKLGHEALRQPEIRAKVIEAFGPKIVVATGEIDRKKLGAVVFSDVGKLRNLEKIVFPYIEKSLREQIAAAQSDPTKLYIVVDAAVMFEAGWNGFCDKIVYVDAPREKRLARLAEQRGWTEAEIEARSQAQLSLDDKASRADATIDNAGPPGSLVSQIAQLLTTWRIPVAI